MRMAVTIVTGAVASLFAPTIAHALPFTPDYSQPANGSGYDQAHNLTPAVSPIQVPPVGVDRVPGSTTIVAHPYIAPWVHELVPVPAHSAVELRGAAEVTVPGAADGGNLVINPNGHCVFSAPGDDSATAPTRLAPVRVDSPLFRLVIEPTLYH
ncbi:hypothetical protein NONO_c67390 [Nocardia nova SH22a]|uniref:Secreted protein n=1 Tax=Nocardia nova SH22a TaxID=1415166 RepID=W5TWF5_9NOCA|nr:hypothetical protein [Nocardia nova]AHH21506.1 hypothetical protein NONO_c67390 [Nocardia nova SH22a]